MRMDDMTFLDSASILPMFLRKLPEAFGLAVSKSWNPKYFNTKENLNYIGPIPEISYFGVNDMSHSERKDFMAWYEEQRDRVFDNRLFLEQYCQVCQLFRREFAEIGNVEIFQESLTIASGYNNLLCKRFLKTQTIGLIPAGRYSCKNN
jgi:hypothetical protein